MNIASEVLIILIVILLNAVFVLSEMSVASSGKTRLQQRINEGDKGSRTALNLIQNPNLFLATVQIGITLVGVFVGAIGGATLSEPLARWLGGIPVLAECAPSLALGIVVLAITFVSIVLGELVPKRIALHNPERIASVLAGPMLVISKLFAPFVWLLGKVTDFFLKLLGIKP